MSLEGREDWLSSTRAREKDVRTVVPSAGPQWIVQEESQVVVDHVINII